MERKAAEARVKELQGLVQAIEGELAQSRQVLEELETKRTAAMVEALERGERAGVAGKTAAMAREREKIEGLVAEGGVVHNILAHAEEALAPFQLREKLVEAVQEWERLVYQCRGLANKRLDWGVRKRACALALERDNAGLEALVLAGIGGEEDLRRHTDRTDYNDLAWSALPFGLYPEVLVLGRSLAAEMGKEGVVVTKIPRVPANEISCALAESHGDRQNRLARYKRFEADYAPELGPDEVAEEKWAGIRMSFE